MLKDHNAMILVRLEPAALRSRVKHSTTEPLRSLTAGLAKIAGYRWCEIKLSCFFFNSLTECNKTSVFLGRGKQWVSLPAVTGYFVKMTSLPEQPPTDYHRTIVRFTTVLYGRTSKHLHEHLLTKKVCLMK